MHTRALTFAQVCVLCLPMAMARIRPPTNVTFDPELLDELDAWLASLPYKIARSSFIEVAVREKLAREKRKLKR